MTTPEEQPTTLAEEMEVANQPAPEPESKPLVLNEAWARAFWNANIRPGMALNGGQVKDYENDYVDHMSDNQNAIKEIHTWYESTMQ